MQFKLTKAMTKRNTALIKDYSSLSSGKQGCHAGGSSHSGFYFQLKRPVFILIFLNVLYIMNIKIHPSKETLALTLLNQPFWCIQVAVFLPRPYYFSFSVVRKRKKPLYNYDDNETIRFLSDDVTMFLPGMPVSCPVISILFCGWMLHAND